MQPVDFISEVQNAFGAFGYGRAFTRLTVLTQIEQLAVHLALGSSFSSFRSGKTSLDLAHGLFPGGQWILLLESPCPALMSSAVYPWKTFRAQAEQDFPVSAKKVFGFSRNPCSASPGNAVRACPVCALKVRIGGSLDKAPGEILRLLRQYSLFIRQLKTVRSSP